MVFVMEDSHLDGLIKMISMWLDRCPHVPLHFRRVRQSGGVVNSISHPEENVVAGAGASHSMRFFYGPIPLAPSCHPLAVVALEEAAEGPGLADCLEAPLKVLVVVAVDYGINAGISEGQPVGEGEDIAGQKIHLVTVQTSVVRHHHQGPERQPGEREKQSHQDEHLNHHELFPGYHRLSAPSFPDFNRAVGHRRLPVGEHRGAQLDPNACVHDRDDGEGRQVDVHEQNHGVDLPHVWVGKVLVAGVEGQRVVEVIVVYHVVIGDLLHSQRQGGRTHDRHRKNPNQQDGCLGNKDGWFGTKWVHYTAKSAIELAQKTRSCSSTCTLKSFLSKNTLNEPSHSFQTTHRSTAMATKVNTDAETDTPCTKPLILHTILEKGQPGGKKNLIIQSSQTCALTETIGCVHQPDLDPSCGNGVAIVTGMKIIKRESVPFESLPALIKVTSTV